MRKTQRLDKVLAHMGYGSRSELRKWIKQKAVAVNGLTVTDFGLQVNP
ncbi:MAG: rsuA3, partial [Paenibacillus sp.]|nr:rsuA3 [Paenibacillus sp.]